MVLGVFVQFGGQTLKIAKEIESAGIKLLELQQMLLICRG